MKLILFLLTLSLYAADYKTDSNILLPDPLVTPGAILTTNKNIICQKGYSKGVRNVTSANKRKAYKEYNQEIGQGLCIAPFFCEIDHLISLELGGSNELQNLWIQPYSHPGAHEKDQLENKLHQLVCSNQISLVDAQNEIKTNWVESYRKHIGPIN